MKTFIKTIKTMTAVLMIIAGLLALFTIDNAQSVTALIVFATIMVSGIAGGLYLLYSIYPDLSDLSGFERDIRILEEYEKEIEELREENLLLLDRYSTLKGLVQGSGYITKEDKVKHPNIYRIVYEEDLLVEGNKLKEEVNDELDRFKEIYN